MRTRIEQLGLVKHEISAKTMKVIEARVKPFKRLHLDRSTLHSLPNAVDHLAQDCYLQGLMDGAALGAKNPNIVLGDAGG